MLEGRLLLIDGERARRSRRHPKCWQRRQTPRTKVNRELDFHQWCQRARIRNLLRSGFYWQKIIGTHRSAQATPRREESPDRCDRQYRQLGRNKLSHLRQSTHCAQPTLRHQEAGSSTSRRRTPSRSRVPQRYQLHPSLRERILYLCPTALVPPAILLTQQLEFV